MNLNEKLRNFIEQVRRATNANYQLEIVDGFKGQIEEVYLNDIEKRDWNNVFSGDFITIYYCGQEVLTISPAFETEWPPRIKYRTCLNYETIDAIDNLYDPVGRFKLWVEQARELLDVPETDVIDFVFPLDPWQRPLCDTSFPLFQEEARIAMSNLFNRHNVEIGWQHHIRKADACINKIESSYTGREKEFFIPEGGLNEGVPILVLGRRELCDFNPQSPASTHWTSFNFRLE